MGVSRRPPPLGQPRKFRSTGAAQVNYWFGACGAESALSSDRVRLEEYSIQKVTVNSIANGQISFAT